MTDVAPARHDARFLLHPATGEVLELDAPTNELARHVEALDDLGDALAVFRQRIVDEVAARFDRESLRSADVGEYKLTTNAPTTETYNLAELRARLLELVEAGVIAPAVVDRVIETPPPKLPEPRVSKREANKLKAHGDPRVGAALDAARHVGPQRRTLKIERKARA